MRTSASTSGVVAVLVSLVALVLAGCGAIPDNTSPQPIRPFERDSPPNAVPTPQADMGPEALVRAFLKATADPGDGHASAREFLTEESSAQWDATGDMMIIDDVNIFIDERSETTARLRLLADNVGTLRDDGQLLPATGRVEATLDLTRTEDQWLIDGALPRGTMIDRNQFDAMYRQATLYFPSTDRTRLVPDPRWLYAGRDTDPTVLVGLLIEGPSTDLSAALDSGFGEGAALRDPVAALADGGVRIDLTGLGPVPPPGRTVIAAQIVWTLAGVETPGPYLINNDGQPLLPQFSQGWQTQDVAEFDPNMGPASDIGLNVIESGALRRVTDDAATPVAGPLGQPDTVRSAAFSSDGSRVAAVTVRSETGGAPLELVLGDYGGTPTPLTSGVSITRPSFGAGNESMWAVVDGRAIRWTRSGGGDVTSVAVDTGSIGEVARGAISEIQIAPDGVRAALLIEGQVVFATVVVDEAGAVTLVQPRIAAYNIGNRAQAIDWASSTTLMIAREAPESPVVQLSINGTAAVGLLSGNLSPPVRSIAADTTSIYVGDSRGVLRLGSSNGRPDQYWSEVPQAMTPGATPVLP